MMKQHTPGPWEAREQLSRGGESLGWIIEAVSGRKGRIGWSSRAFADTNQEEPKDGPEAAANASLIAAAPELLVALKEHDAYMSANYSDGPTSDALHPAAAKNWVRARAAIAKAEPQR